MSFLTLVYQTDPGDILCNARIRPSVFPGLVGFTGAFRTFRRQDGDVHDVSTYIILFRCVLSQLCYFGVVLFSNCKDRLL